MRVSSIFHRGLIFTCAFNIIVAGLILPAGVQGEGGGGGGGGGG